MAPRNSGVEASGQTKEGTQPTTEASQAERANGREMTCQLICQFMTVYRRADHLPPSTRRAAECGGIEPPRPPSRPQTGFEDRPGHQAHAFRKLYGRSFYYRPSTVAAGQDPNLARAARHPTFVRVLEPGLGVLATRPKPVAQPGERDLAALPTDGLYLVQDVLGGLPRG